jgi:hypothetical protein
MVRVSLDTVILLIIVVALLVGVSQAVPAITERLQQMLVTAAEVK